MTKQFRAIRRQDRTWDETEARQLLERGEYGFLALCSPEGYGYGIPMSYAADGDTLYFHCAPEGHKLEAVDGNDRVSFCVVGPTRVIPGKFTTNYSSVHLFGRIERVEEPEQRLRALRLLVKKYAPGFEERAEKYIAGSFGRTVVLRLDIEHLSAKGKFVRG